MLWCHILWCDLWMAHFKFDLFFEPCQSCFSNVSCLWLSGSGSLRKIIKGWKRAFMTTKLQSIVCVSALNLSIIHMFWVDLQTKEKEKIKIKQLKKTSKQNKEKTPAEATVCHFPFSSQMVAGELLTWRRLKGEKDIQKKTHVTTVVKGKSRCSIAHCTVVEAKGIHKRHVCYTGESETKQAARREMSSCWSPSN